MKVLLDTNIVVDILSKRKGYKESLQVFQYCELGKVTGYVSAITVTDVLYILRKHIAPEEVRNTVQALLLIVDVAGILKSDISAAFASKMKDFEDALQSSCAKRIKADYIVTRNIDHFKESDVPAILPLQVIKILAN